MKAIILCAGYGSRLGDLTKDIPKPMLPLNGYPMLSYILSNCKQNGFSEIAINLHFKPEIIKQYFGDGSRYGLSIRYFYEETLLGTAGSVRYMADFIGKDNTFLVHYGDILTDQNLFNLVTFHQSRPDSYATLLVHSRTNSNSIVIADKNGRIRGFLERPSDDERKKHDSTLVNSGIAILDRRLLAAIGENAVDLPKDIYSRIYNDCPLYCYTLESYRIAVDSAERYRAAEEALIDRRCNLSHLS